MFSTLSLKKSVAIVASAALTATGLFGLGAPAFAATASNPTVTFDGNTLATSAPVDERAERLAVDSLNLSAAALTRVVATTRAGYTFGGWSLTRGGPVATEITTTTTSDTFRILYAVWNTTVRYNANGADSGALTNFKIQDVYRFGQTLSLPTAGTLVKSGFSFGGWMDSPYSANRATIYTAGSSAVGNPILYAAWTKAVSFNANGATSGVAPALQTFTDGGPRLKLPVISEMTLRKKGHEFVGWAAFPTGAPVSNPSSYIPIGSAATLYAVWRLETTAAMSRVFFNPGKAGLRAKQKLILRDLVDNLQNRDAIKITVAAQRSKASTARLGKKRNTAVVRYLRSLGVEATFSRSNVVGKGRSETAKKNNRVSLSATWTNRAS